MLDPILSLSELVSGDSDSYIRQNERNLVAARLHAPELKQTAVVAADPSELGSVLKGDLFMVTDTPAAIFDGTMWDGVLADSLVVALSDAPTAALGWALIPPARGMSVMNAASDDTIQTYESTGWESSLTTPGTVPDDLVYVNSILDLPAAVANVITLVAGWTYIIVGSIDLVGDRIVLADGATMGGFSHGNSQLTSTGLGASVALITGTCRVYFSDIHIHDVGTVFDFTDTVTSDIVMKDMHFHDCTTLGTVDGYGSQAWVRCIFVDCGTISFDGTVNVASFYSCTFESPTADIQLHLLGTLIVDTGFHILDSTWDIDSGGTGLQIETDSTIPDDGVVIRNVNFSGAGTFINDITPGNHSFYVGNTGIANTTWLSHYYMSGNATATTIATQSVAVKVAGTTTDDAITERFINTTTNRATYDNLNTKKFHLTAVATLTSGNNNDVALHVYKNGSDVAGSDTHVTTSGGGQAQNATIQTLVSLDTSDYLEIWVSNETGTTDITVTDINVVINATN
jgi:hypothetical protein